MRDGIEASSDLAGARIGIRQYRTSVIIWTRGILAEHFGVDISSITWAAGIIEFSPTTTALAASKRSKRKPPCPKMLIDGEIDAMISNISGGALFDRLEAEPGVKRPVRRLPGRGFDLEHKIRISSAHAFDSH